MRILISGFEPFAGRGINPTSKLIESINRKEIIFPQNFLIETIILPVTFSDSFKNLNEKINEFNPDVVIAFGQAAGRSCIELESVATNKINAEIPDNSGFRPIEELISPHGPDFYQSTLPLQGFEGKLKEANIPVKISKDAGRYVCNYLFYRLMENNQASQRLCGFIHVPLLPEQIEDNTPSMELALMKKALSILLEYIDY